MFRPSTLCVSIAVAVTAGSACGNPNGPGNGGGQTDPPTITCPGAPPSQTSPNGQPVAVSYGTAIATGNNVGVTCSPVSGGMYPVGSTTVVCTATDSGGRTAACSFTVVVQMAPRLSLTRFAAFGDSITWGEDGTNNCSNFAAYGAAFARIRPRQQLPTSQQYPTVLLQLLQGRYVGQNVAVNGLGKQGEQAGDPATWTRFTSNVVASRAYDAVLLMEGANDVNAGTPSAGISGLQTMVQSAKAGGVRVFLATIPPELAGGSVFPGLNPIAVQSFNNNVRSLALSQNVTLVDVEQAFGASPRQYLSCDLLHPNPSGYQLIANTFFNVLTQTLETRTSTPTTTFGVPSPVLPRSPLRRRP